MTDVSAWVKIKQIPSSVLRPLLRALFPRALSAGVLALVACARPANHAPSEAVRRPDSHRAPPVITPGTDEVLARDRQLAAGWTVTRTRETYERAGETDSLVSGTILYFSNGESLATDLVAVRQLGALPAQRKAPFLVLRAVGCTNCDMNESIYIHSASDGALVAPRSERRFSAPGDLLDAETDSVIERNRFFIGHCSLNLGPLGVWFYRLRTDNGPWQDTVFVARVVDDSLHSEFASVRSIPLEQAISSVRAGRCSEVPGERRRAEP